MKKPFFEIVRDFYGEPPETESEEFKIWYEKFKQYREEYRKVRYKPISLMNHIRKLFGRTYVQFPEYCGVCGVKIRGNFIIGYWFPCRTNPLLRAECAILLNDILEKRGATKIN